MLSKHIILCPPFSFCLQSFPVSRSFPVVRYGCESWAIKKAEHLRTDAFELWCRRRLDSSLDWKEIKSVNPKGNLPLEKTLILGRTEGKRRREGRG